MNSTCRLPAISGMEATFLDENLRGCNFETDQDLVKCENGTVTANQETCETRQGFS